jgi:CRP-like cAMP-binding protein
MNEQIKHKIENFFAQFKEVSFKKGEEIISPHEDLKYIHYLKEGHVRQHLVTDKGVEITLHVYESGAFFPLTWGINNITNKYHFAAQAECIIRKAPRETVIEFLKSNPDVLFNLSERLLYGLNGLLVRIEYLTAGTALTRVAGTVEYLVKHYGKKEAEKIIIDQRFTHEDIAGIACLARETTSQNLEKLIKEGILEYHNHLLVVKNTTKLHEVASGE